jgi:hypothetical protein
LHSPTPNQPKTGKSLEKSAFSGETREKPVEIGDFPLTLTGIKPHCNHRQGSSKPHEYWGFVHIIQAIEPLMRYTFRGQKPVITGSPKGRQTKESITWQLD